MTTPVGPAFAIGKFDALHLGHRALAGRAGALGEPTLLQFSGMAEILGWPERAPLVARSDRQRVIASWSQLFGQAVLSRELPFSTVRPMAPEAFVAFLAGPLRARAVVVGEDFRFGRDRAGDLQQLARLAGAHGIHLVVVPAVCALGKPISSSRVRAALEAGDVGETSACLGRPYRLVGTVVRGDGRGRQLGFPTANCAERENLTPGGGVYAAWATIGTGADAPVLRAAVNIGRLPSVGEQRPITVEAHLLDYAHECYGSRLALDFVARLRDEQRFADLAALRGQIARDVAAARTHLTTP